MYWLTISSMISSVYSWNMKSGRRLEDISLLYYTVIIVSHSISRGLGNIEQTPLRKSATYSRKKASKFNVSYFFSFSVLLTCCSVTSSVIKASRSSITTLHRSQLRLFESLTVSMSSTLEPDTLNSIRVSHILIYYREAQSNCCCHSNIAKPICISSK